MAARKHSVRSVAALRSEGAPTYVNSPKGVGSKKPTEEPPKVGAGTGAGGDAGQAKRAPDLRKTRRRLSVVSDNKLVEGVAALDAEGDDAVAGKSKSVVAKYAGVSKKGFAPYNPRKKNQDSIIMAEHEESGALFIAAMDGHGEMGDLVSGYFKARLPRMVFGHPAFMEDPNIAMKESLAAIEEQVLKDASIDTEFSGTTAVLAVIKDHDLFVANVGDSRIILGVETEGGDLVPEGVSRDHKPDLPDEKARIVGAGGRVFAVEYDDGIDGPARVWLGHMDIPGLAMSRSLGDEVAHTAGVTSEPELHHRRLTSRDKILVMGSDGLWEFLSNEEVVREVAATEDPMHAVRQLAEESYARWMAEEQVVDDTTIIVCYLDCDE